MRLWKNKRIKGIISNQKWVHIWMRRKKKLKRRIEICRIVLFQDGIERLKLFWLKRDTIKQLIFGVWAAFFPNWSFVQMWMLNHKTACLTRTIDIYFQVLLAFLFLPSTMMKMKKQTINKMNKLTWYLKMIKCWRYCRSKVIKEQILILVLYVSWVFRSI